jgi:hypothetical protein
MTIRVVLMKMVNATVDMIAVFHKGEPPEPFRFIYRKNGVEHNIKVGKVVDLKKVTYGNTKNYVYTCSSLIGRRERIYELRYIGSDVRWELHKI